MNRGQLSIQVHSLCESEGSNSQLSWQNLCMLTFRLVHLSGYHILSRLTLVSLFGSSDAPMNVFCLTVYLFVFSFLTGHGFLQHKAHGHHLWKHITVQSLIRGGHHTCFIPWIILGLLQSLIALFSSVTSNLQMDGFMDIYWREIAHVFYRYRLVCLSTHAKSTLRCWSI